VKNPPLWLYFGAAGVLVGVAVVLYLLGRSDAAAGVGAIGGLGLGGAVRAAARVGDARATVRETVVASRRRQSTDRERALVIKAQIKREQAASAKAAVDRLNERFPPKGDE
jgi:hypothetical protein